MLYTINTLIQTIKEDIDLPDLPPIVNDEVLIDRLSRSALIAFSILYPRLEKFNMNFENIDNKNYNGYNRQSRGITYNIPKYFLMQFTPIVLVDVHPFTAGGIGDYAVPLATYSDPYDVISMVDEIRTRASVASNITPASTWHYDNMNQNIILYKAYCNSVYEVTMGVKHEINLSTIPDTAMLTFKDLATLDLGGFIYNKLKRKDGSETGAGQIELKIDHLANSAEEYKNLIKELSEDANLDFERVQIF